MTDAKSSDTLSTEILGKRTSLARITLIEHAPFFATLAFHADIQASDKHGTAWTNGHQIFFNPEFAKTLSDEAFVCVLLHEILHCALHHVRRCGNRDPLIWNVAADFVVNALLQENHLLTKELPLLYDREFEDRSVEDIYARLNARLYCRMKSLMPFPEGDLVWESSNPADSATDEDAGAAHWRNALKHAIVFKNQVCGSAADEMLREVERPMRPSVDWRHQLARFVTLMPTDYAGIDRRFVHRGIYTDAIGQLSANLVVCIDTSASISDSEFDRFTDEVRGILSSYPGINCRLFFADTDLHGPFELTTGSTLPSGAGGGGTSFAPLFDWLATQSTHQPDTVLYLTDGYGDFPENTPVTPVIWAVTASGACDSRFPFGEILRLPF